jgi:hypothetical protein
MLHIDHLLADSILDRLGYTLQDLSLDYGDVVIENGEISHQLYYSSIYSTANIMGYVYHENNFYYTFTGNNRSTPQEAALDLLDRETVENMAIATKLERSKTPNLI